MSSRVVVEYRLASGGAWLICLGDEHDTFDDVVAALHRLFSDVVETRARE